MNAAIRGACPGTTTPMMTGDGLLARLVPYEPIPIEAFQILCAAAAEYGNGIVEVTQRGSLQVRGLRDTSARTFADIVVALGIGQDDRPALLTSPLLGIDADGLLDASALASALRSMLANRGEIGQPSTRGLPSTVGSQDPVGSLGPASSSGPVSSLNPKVSVLLDGGGRLHLDAVPADIRLRAVSASRFELALAGDASTAVPLSYVSFDDVVATIENLLAQIASLGVRARAKDLLAGGGSASDSLALAMAATRPGTAAHPGTPGHPGTPARAGTPAHPIAAARPRADAIGHHQLRNGTVARGFGLAFGHATAAALIRLARAATARGVTSFRPAPGRTLLAIGLKNSEAANELDAFARAEGFIVDPTDPRRHVIACAGAPACASASLPTRQLAPEVANAVRSLVGTEKIVHLSGCTKGCAHPKPAAVTLIGPNHWLLNGRASDTPQGTISPDGLVATVKQLCAEDRP